jgi:glycosyltransferase involved in cell wall biosynthesis
MKFLIVTQVLDKNDPILGFFHRWVEEFAKHCEAVTVICLKKGVCELPDNVHVFSLGKEDGVSKFEYVRRFYLYSWRKRSTYESVFVHMIPEYLILGAILWRFLRKRVGFWYAHGAVTFKLRVANLLANHIFTSTNEGFRIGSRKKKIVGQGIDCTHFKLGPPHDVTKMITVGRITRLKHLDVLINAVGLLNKDNFGYVLHIYGLPVTEDDFVYLKELHTLINDLGLSKTVIFCDAVTYAELPDTLRRYGIFLSAGQTGSLDKAILEAAATGRTVISSNQGARVFLKSTDDRLHIRNTPEDFCEAVRNCEKLTPVQLSELAHTLSESVRKEHELASLIRKIVSFYTLRI